MATSKVILAILLFLILFCKFKFLGSEKELLEKVLEEKKASLSPLSEKGLLFSGEDDQTLFLRLLALQPLTTSVLRRMWNLTRSDGGAGISSTQTNTVLPLPLS